MILTIRTEKTNMAIGENIKRERLAKGMTMEQLAKELGVGKSCVNKWEKGTVVNIKFSTIEQMAEIFGCSPSSLIGYEAIDSNREVIADNIKYYMELHNVSSTEVCKSLGFRQNTFSDWVNAKSYPRIDKIEKLAKYFNIPKSALVEKRTTTATSAISEHEWKVINAYRISPHKEAINSLLGLKNDESSAKDNVKENIRNNLVAFRLESGMTQTEVGEYVGKSKTAVASWEQGLSSPDAEVLYLLSLLFKKTIGQMYGKEGADESN